MLRSGAAQPGKTALPADTAVRERGLAGKFRSAACYL